MKQKKQQKRSIADIVRAVVSLALCTVLLSALLFRDYSFVYGVDEIESIEDELEAAQDEADEISDELEQAESDAAEVQSEISSLNAQLSELSSSIEELNTQITQKETEIAELETEIAAAEKAIAENEEAAQTQYESLSAWIQVSYENDFSNMIVSVLAAESISAALAQAEYVQSLARFGFDLLERYNNTLAELKEQKENLQTQTASLEESLADLEALEEEAGQKKTAVATAIAAAQETLSSLNSSISSLEAELAEQGPMKPSLKSRGRPKRRHRLRK